MVKKTADRQNEENEREYQLALIEIEKEAAVAQSTIVEYRELLLV